MNLKFDYVTDYAGPVWTSEVNVDLENLILEITRNEFRTKDFIYNTHTQKIDLINLKEKLKFEDLINQKLLTSRKRLNELARQRTGMLEYYNLFDIDFDPECEKIANQLAKDLTYTLYCKKVVNDLMDSPIWVGDSGRVYIGNFGTDIKALYKGALWEIILDDEIVWYCEHSTKYRPSPLQFGEFMQRVYQKGVSFYDKK